MKKKILVLISILIGLDCHLIALPLNIASNAQVIASSELTEEFRAENVIDGIIGISNKGEWACKGNTTSWGYVDFPWIQLMWGKPQAINKVVLYDRPNLEEHIAGGKLLFSDGSIIWVNQIPNDGTAKAITFPSKTVEWIKFIVTDGDGKNLGLSEIEVFPAFSENSDYVSKVDPYIETNRGRYFFFITGARPFGMVGSAPLTRNKNQWGGGYNYNETEVLGIPQIHTWMISGIEIMPTSTEIDPTLGEKGWKSSFSHDDEIVQPGYHRIFLRNYKIWTEMTATDRVTFHRFCFTEGMDAQILINLGGYLGNSTMKAASVKKVNDREIEGYFNSTDRFWGGPKNVEVFFIAQFDEPFKQLDGWKGTKRYHNISEISGDSTGVSAIYSMHPGDKLQMKIAVSYTSIENARKNLEIECPAWNFDEVRHNSQLTWNEMLGKIKVEGGVPEQQIKFYTDLWHVLLGRQKIDDINGYYPDRTSGRREGNFTDAIFKIRQLPLDANGNPKYHMYNSDAFWGTQWNLNILWGLAWPEILDDMSASMIQYAENGYLLPRGPCGGGYSYIMTNCPTTNMIVSAYMRNLLTKKDAFLTYQIIRQNHLPGGMLGNKEEVEFYTRHGYWPDNAGITVEAAFEDYAVAQMAQKMGRKKDYQFFLKRSSGWKKLFDPQEKLLFPKDRKGNFIHKDPLSGVGWVEANSWQATCAVSHDIPGLAKLMGGNDTLCKKLNYAFEMSEANDFVFSYSEGYINYANQPSCANAHVFNYAGKPWLSQYWVRKV